MTYSYYPTKLLSRDRNFANDIEKSEFSIKKIERNIFEISKKLRHLDTSVSPIFNSDIKPIQCDNSTAAISEIIEIIGQSSYILEHSSLQLNNKKNKYKLSAVLYHLDEQLLNLLILINDLRSICFEETRKKIEIQEEIRERFHKICNAQSYFHTKVP